MKRLTHSVVRSSAQANGVDALRHGDPDHAARTPSDVRVVAARSARRRHRARRAHAAEAALEPPLPTQQQVPAPASASVSTTVAARQSAV